MDKAPEIILRAKDGSIIHGDLNLRGNAPVWRSEYSWKGYHQPCDVFMALGQDIKSIGLKLKGLKIYDLAPAILHMFDLPIPADVDGYVLNEIFREGSDVFLLK